MIGCFVDFMKVRELLGANPGPIQVSTINSLYLKYKYEKEIS